MRKPKNASSFRKPEEENVAVSSQKADFPVSHMKEISETSLSPLSLPYLSKKRNKRVSAMVMRTPPQRGILGQRLKWKIKEKKRNSKKKTLFQQLSRYMTLGGARTWGKGNSGKEARPWVF